MLHRGDLDDGWEDEAEGEEFDDDLGAGEEDDEEPTVPCPYCRELIHEDAQRCPCCGNYVSGEDHAPPRRPWWIVITALICLLLIYFWIAH
jgi:uncharacterized paraquat-inducible protein A